MPEAVATTGGSAEDGRAESARRRSGRRCGSWRPRAPRRKARRWCSAARGLSRRERLWRLQDDDVDDEVSNSRNGPVGGREDDRQDQFLAEHC
jgi:hypothetical protein